MRLKRWIWRRNTKQPLTTSNLKSQNKVNIYLYQQIDKSAVRTLKKLQAATSAQELFVLIVGYYNIETSAKNKNITNNGNQKITRNDGNNIIPVIASTTIAAIFQIRLKLKKSFTEIWWPKNLLEEEFPYATKWCSWEKVIHLMKL